MSDGKYSDCMLILKTLFPEFLKHPHKNTEDVNKLRGQTKRLHPIETGVLCRKSQLNWEKSEEIIEDFSRRHPLWSKRDKTIHPVERSRTRRTSGMGKKLLVKKLTLTFDFLSLNSREKPDMVVCSWNPRNRSRRARNTRLSSAKQEPWAIKGLSLKRCCGYEYTLCLQRTHVYFPAATLGRSQRPIPPTLQDVTLFWSLRPSAHICKRAHIYMIKIKQITVFGEFYLTDTRWKLVVAKSACKHHIYEQKEILAGGDAWLCLCVWFCPLFPSQWWALDVIWLRMPHIGSHISLGPSLVAVFGEVIRPLGMEIMCSN